MFFSHPKATDENSTSKQDVLAALVCLKKLFPFFACTIGSDIPMPTFCKLKVKLSGILYVIYQPNRPQAFTLGNEE
jgi:hypothetical protein